MTYNQKNYIIDYNNITNKPFLSLDERKLRVINGQLTTVFINSNFTEGSNIEINIDGAISVPDNIFRKKIQEFGSGTGTSDSYFQQLNQNEIYVLSNVGIGLSDPNAPLHIFNNTNTTSFIIEGSHNDDAIKLNDTSGNINDIFINFNEQAKIGLVNNDIVFKKVSNSSNLKITDDFVEISDETYLKLNKGYVNDTLYLGREIGYDNSETNVKLDLFNYQDTSLKLSSYHSDVNDSNEYYIKSIKTDTESYFAISSGDLNVFKIQDSNITAEYDLDVLGTTRTEQLKFGKINLIQIACGRFYTMVLTDLGEVWGWGDNGYYQVNSIKDVDGEGNELDYIKDPKEITNFSPEISHPDKIIQIACGGFHTMFLTDLGKVYGCGLNSGRQINSTGTTIITPTEVTVLPTSSTDKIIQIACGAYYTMFLTESGKVYGCGNNDYYQVNSTKDVDGDTELDYIKDPKEITNFSPEISHPDKIIQIACGNEHTIFLTNSGKVYGCGRNDYYQVDSVRTEVDSRYVKITPTEITDLPTDKIIQISCGWYHTMFLTDLGEVLGRGRNDNKQINSNLSPVIYPYKILKSDFILSDGTSSPPLGNITQIACGSYHTMFLTDIGEVYGRGYNYYKQILLNSDTNNNIYSPTKITDFSPPISTQDKIIQIACGMSHTMFLTETDQVWGRGRNNNNQVHETDDDKIQTPKKTTLKFINKGKIGIEESDTGDYYFRIYTTTDTNISLSTKVDTHTLVISSNDNIGINKTNPDSNYKLDVEGNLNIDGIATISSNLSITSNLTVGSNIYFSGDLYKNGNLYTSYTDEDTKILLNTGIGKSNIVFENARIKEEDNHLIINTNINYSNIILKEDKIFLNYDKESISSIIDTIGNDNTLEVNGDINLASGKKFKIDNEDISLFSTNTYDINYKGKLYYGHSNVNTNDLISYNEGNIINFIDRGNGIGISGNEILQLGISDNNSIKFDNSNIIISSNLIVESNIYFSGDLFKNGNLYTSYTDSDTSNYLLNNLDTSIIPKDSLTYDLGSAEYRFRDLYIGANSIWFGDSHKMSVSGDKIKMKKIKTDVIPQGLVTKLSMSEDDIKQDIINHMRQSVGGDSGFYAGGKNYSGQLGLGDQESRILLNKINFFNNDDIIISNTTSNISSSDEHTLFLDNEGKVYSCGYNYDGRLGHGNTIDSYTPYLIDKDINDNQIPIINKISAGGVHSLILDDSGKVYSFGNDDYGQLGLGSTVPSPYRPTLITNFDDIYVKDIAAGHEYSLFLTNSGQVYSCGRNNYGQLGIGGTTNKDLPNLIQYKNDDTLMPEITKIKCGKNISLFLDVDGNVYSCGRNIEYQLGINDNINRYRATEIQNYQDQNGTELSKPKIIDMSAGEYHILLLDEDGQVYSCGTNVGGILGFRADNFDDTIYLIDNSFKFINKPTLITNFIDGQGTSITTTPKISKISCGYMHSLFLDVDGSAYSCGLNTIGQLCHDIHYNNISFPDGVLNYTYTPTLITKIQNDDGESDIPNNIIDITASSYSTFITTGDVVSISLSDLSLKDWLDYGKSKNTTITNINDIFTDEDADDENLDIWLTNNSDIYLNSFNYNRLGIGTTNPEETLHVEGNAIISSNLTITSNLTVGSNIYFSGDLYQNGNLYTSYTDSDTSNYLLNNLNTSIIPSSIDSEYNLGSSTNRFSNLYLDGSLLISEVDVISQLDANSNFLKEIIYSSNQIQNEKLHNTSNLLHNTSNFLKAIIYSSNQIQNEKLHNTSNFLKAIISKSNIDLTELINGCNENASNYINRIDVLTSNIYRQTDNSYIIDTDLFIDGNLKASNLEVIGEKTVIETDTYRTENLEIINISDEPSLKIKHDINTNNILDFGTINNIDDTNYQSKLTLDNTGLLKLYGGLEINGNNSFLTTCNIIPKVTEKFSLGNETNRFNDLYLNGNLLIGEVDVISQLDANSNFLKAIIYSSNQIQNENLHNTSNLLHSTSNFLKAIIDQSNIDLTNLIEGCNENVSNYINRIDVLTSNIEVLSDNSYKISTDITLDGLLRISNRTSNKVELLTTNGIWNIDVLDYQTSNYTIERKYPPIDLLANDFTITGQDYGDGRYVVDSSSSGSAAYNAFKDYVNMSFDQNNYHYSSGYYERSDIYIKSDYLGDYLQIKLPQMIKLTKYKFKQVTSHNSPPLSDYKIYGSNDGSNWVELFHRASTFTYIYGVFEENVNTTERYYYFALVVNRINNYEYSNPFNKLWFYKFEIYGKELLDITDYNTLTITNENNKGLQIYKNGFFGFNNNTPENTIDVNGNINTSNIEDKTALIINQTVEQPIIDIKKNDQSVLFINESRYIGINNNIPSKTLDITGDARISSNLTITSNLIVGSNIYFSGDLYQGENLYTSYTDSDTSNYLLNNLDTSIIPSSAASEYNLGSSTNRFSNLYLDGNLLIGDSNVINEINDINSVLLNLKEKNETNPMIFTNTQVINQKEDNGVFVYYEKANIPIYMHYFRTYPMNNDYNLPQNIIHFHTNYNDSGFWFGGYEDDVWKEWLHINEFALLTDRDIKLYKRSSDTDEPKIIFNDETFISSANDINSLNILTSNIKRDTDNNYIIDTNLTVEGNATISSNLTITSNLIVGSNIYFSGNLYQGENLYTSYTDDDTRDYIESLNTSIIPSATDTHSLGSDSLRFKNIYLNENIYLNQYSEIHPGSEGILKIEGDLHIKYDMVAHYSDERLKNKLEDIKDVLNKIKDLNVIKYNNSSLADKYGFENKKQIGLIAQEIIKIYPEIVTLAPFDTIKKDGNKESKSGENYLTLKYERLVPILLQAIKELNEKNNLLEEKYEKLSIDIDKIKKYLNIID